MFVDCQKFAGLWGRNFVGNWFVALQCKTISLFNIHRDESWTLILANNDDFTVLLVCPSTHIKKIGENVSHLQPDNELICKFMCFFFLREMTLYENCCTKLCGFLGCLTAKVFHKAVSTDSQRKYLQCTHRLIYTLRPSGSQDLSNSWNKLICFKNCVLIYQIVYNFYQYVCKKYFLEYSDFPSLNC